MSNNRLGIYPEDDAREIHKRVLGHSLPLQELGQAKQHTFHNMLYYAVLTEDLAPATNATTGYTSAENAAPMPTSDRNLPMLKLVFEFFLVSAFVVEIYFLCLLL